MTQRPPEAPTTSEAMQPYPIQLSDVWLQSIRLVRRAIRPDDDVETPTITRSPVRSHRRAASPTECSLRVEIIAPVYEGEVLHLRMTVRARVNGDQDAPRGLVSYFYREQAFFLLWPFARSQFDQLARLAGVQLPPLPLLSVPAEVSLPGR